MKNADTSRHTQKTRLLGASFFADHSKHRLRNLGDLAASRTAFLHAATNNLKYLMNSRFNWMNEWIKERDVVVEIGAGAGLSSLYLAKHVFTTDIIPNTWLSAAMDGTKLAFKDESVDVIIVSNALHHFPYPLLFLKEADRVLKNDGLILIFDAYCSLLLRLLLRLLNHEGYSFDIDIFDSRSVANDPKDPWSGNNAVANLFFDSRGAFESNFPNLRIIRDAPCECLVFLASGGVTSKLTVPQLPIWLLDCIAALDSALVKTVPKLFALSRRTVLESDAAPPVTSVPPSRGIVSSPTPIVALPIS